MIIYVLVEFLYRFIFCENMWKYVTRRFRDTLERGANDLGRCSTTLVNNGAVNNNDEINECSHAPLTKWLSLRNTKSHLNDNCTNGPKWSSEHRGRNWMGAITWVCLFGGFIFITDIIILSYQLHLVIYTLHLINTTTT